LRIAIFDYTTISNNPTGGCNLRLLRDLSREHEFTVFSLEFENPDPDRIQWVRIPVPKRPLALLFIAFHVVAPLVYFFHRLRRKVRFDLVQFAESNLLIGDVSYAHFCHSAYLNQHWASTKGAGLRRWLRWADHKLHALLEGSTFRRVTHIVVPSRGLASEIVKEFPHAAKKTTVLPNAVDVERLSPDPAFNREDFRREWGFGPGDTVFLFMALGHFERKGLPLLLDALVALHSPETKLLVVGGEPDLISSYQTRIEQSQTRIEQSGLKGQVIFAGMQRDVRPFFWASDAFAFPSLYETFSLVTYEAAAAGLPIIAPPLNGVEELIRDGKNGFVIPRTVDGIAAALKRFLAMSTSERAQLGQNAKAAAAGYNQSAFSQRWREFYRQCAS
jgi:glycosyltransferase involved in cell wall biosynthesis